MVVGLYSNKFHELCCSHLFCILSIFYHIKVPQVMKQSNHCEDLIETIETDISFALFGVPERSPRWIRLGRFKKTPEPSPSKSFRD
jgi:hypothetical protein